MNRPPEPPPHVLVLAAGSGSRFIASGGQGSKLQALFRGRPVLDHVLDAVRLSGLPWHVEHGPHPHMGDSIAAAVAACPDANGWLVLPGDLPLIRADTLRLIAGIVPADRIARACWQGRPGHPVRFPSACRSRLLALGGQPGAAGLLSAAGCLSVPVDDPGCVADVDQLSDLRRLEQLPDRWARSAGEGA